MTEQTVVPPERRTAGLNRTYILLFLGAVIAGLLLILGAGVMARPYQFMGSKIDPPLPAPDFTLTDQSGSPYHLAEHRGNVVLVFFGYTNCPDVCPTTLAEFKQVHESLGEQAGQVEFLFVTVDPERDTVERLAAYLPTFGAGIRGLTGTSADLEPVWKGYNIYVNKVESDSAAGYLMEHSTRTYAIDREGNIRVTYLFGTEPGSILRDTQYLLGEK